MSLLQLVVRFIFHSVAVYIGARSARVEADLGKVVVTVLISYALMWVGNIVFYPLKFVLLLNLLVDSAVALLATAIASKLVMGCKWNEAFQISVIAAVMALVGRLLAGWLGF